MVDTTGSFRFERFLLDPEGRRLKRDDVTVELNSRYLDALVLLVREQGNLVSKSQFLEKVWSGVPVTDEALTQCIKTLRKQLGDSAANPRFIETIPKHGYRFIAPVILVDRDAKPTGQVTARPAPKIPFSYPWREFFMLGGAGTLGGGLAGMLGGVFYGFGGASQALQPAMGAASVLLVLVCLSLLVGLMGGAGVGFGIAAAGLAPGRWLWSMVGGASGGLVVGALVNLIGVDAFNLLFGQSPGDIAGAAEGTLLGAAVGLAVWYAIGKSPLPSLGRSLAAAALAGGAAGLLIALLGGRLMGGSLDLLARSFAGSRLRLDHIAVLLGENEFGSLSRMVTGGIEGALFSACIVGVMALARQRLNTSSPQLSVSPVS